MRWEGQYKEVLEDIISEGKRCHPSRPCRELISYQFILENPRDRILRNPSAPFWPAQGLAQFLWMLRGEHELEPMRFYSRKADQFSADERTMRGAYGFRFRGPGYLNQLKWIMGEKLIDEDAQDPKDSRRALVAIYLPQFDQHMERDEVPCTALLQYFNRDGVLHATTYMRSQNAFGLLPLDIFLLTMLHEFVAKSVRCRVGIYHHICGSIHIYEKDFEAAQKAANDNSNPLDPMLEMPDDVSATILPIMRSERILRQVAETGWSIEGKESAIGQEEVVIREFPTYTRNYMGVLLSWCYHKIGRSDSAKKHKASLPEYFSTRLSI